MKAIPGYTWKLLKRKRNTEAYCTKNSMPVLLFHTNFKKYCKTMSHFAVRERYIL